MAWIASSSLVWCGDAWPSHLLVLLHFNKELWWNPQEYGVVV